MWCGEDVLSFAVTGHGEDGDGFFVLIDSKVAAEDVVGKTVLLDGTRARVRAAQPSRTGTALYLYPPEAADAPGEA